MLTHGIVPVGECTEMKRYQRQQRKDEDIPYLDVKVDEPES